MKKSGIDDEAVASGENLLLTFTNIRNEVGKGNDIFDQSTQIMADMSTALGQDMKTSAIQLGKALNNPTKGVSALQRVGVSFTESQKDQIKALQASGKTMEAQKIILKELQGEFGGSAEAAGKTLPGQLNIARETFNNFAGMLVSKVVPVLEDTIAWLRDHWPEIRREIAAFWSQVQPVFANLIDIAREVVDTIRTHWGTIGPIVTKVASIVGDAAKIIIGALRLITDLIKGDWSAAWDDLKNIAKAALDGVKNLLTLGPSIWLPLAKKLGAAILNGIVDGITGVVSDVETKLNNIKQAITDAAAGAYTNAKNFGAKILSGIGDGIGSVVGAVKGKIQAAIDLLDIKGDFIESAKKVALAFGEAFVKSFTAPFELLAGLLKRLVGSAINAALGLWNNLRIPGFHVKIKIPGPVPDIDFGWGGMDLPDIPLLKFAQGGVVDQPTLGLLGEGRQREIVAPEPLLRELLAEQRPQVRVFIGDRELTDLVRVEVVGQHNRVAQTLLAGAV
jgi:hypothetical protein